MRNLVDLFVRFSHVFFISRCCIYNDAHDPSQNVQALAELQTQDSRETPEENRREAESSIESIQEGIPSHQEARSVETQEILNDDDFYDVQLNN